ncbi:DUF2878 domain-containing protein [Salinicola sp. RZ23]|uniref:DUF2878 domain-containing protein n=1 Tax=Salinicola sp. RZ23 TaxID=1949087 RepID=UPI000DA1F863|nr:DUF2878 domain-containing protein [Salinicola sp. RZ23]
MSPRRPLALVLNALVFQIGWFVCVLGGSVPAMLALVLILAAHWRWLARSGEWRWWLGFALAGMAVDGTLVALGGIRLASGWPLWLWALWPLFATTLHHCLAWLWPHRWLALVCGAVGGPLSYLSGAALAGAEITTWALVVEALVWAGLCAEVSRRLGGAASAQA